MYCEVDRDNQAITKMPKPLSTILKTSLLIITTLLASNTYAQQSTETSDPSDHDITITVSPTDSLMNDAKLKARNTWNIFYDTYNQKQKNQRDFSVKYPFKTPTGHEHIWLTHIKIRRGKITGKVNNKPEQTTEVKFGEKVNINPLLISDWMFYEDGKLQGGYTILVSIEQLPPDQKKKMKKHMGIYN